MPPARYDAIGRSYDRTRRADPRIVDELVRHLHLDVGMHCLDLACGTGNYAMALLRTGASIVGLDVSWKMLSTARGKSASLPLVAADAEALPFPDDRFEAVVCCLAAHHFRDSARVFSEVRRVMRPGRFVTFTATAEQMRGYWLNEYFPRALARSIEQMPALAFMKGALRQAGFRFVCYEPWSVPSDLLDLFLYSGKHRPGLYLEPEVRRSISTFANLAEPGEIERGVRRLRHDIASGRIDEVVAAYRNDAGDYGFAIAEATP